MKGICNIYEYARTYWNVMRAFMYMLARWNGMRFKKMKYQHFYCISLHILEYIWYMPARIYASIHRVQIIENKKL